MPPWARWDATRYRPSSNWPMGGRERVVSIAAILWAARPFQAANSVKVIIRLRAVNSSWPGGRRRVRPGGRRRVRPAGVPAQPGCAAPTWHLADDGRTLACVVMRVEQVVIAGAGLAGLRTAEELRSRGYQ